MDVPRSVLVNRGGKWVEVSPSGKERTASGSYNFVVQDGVMYGARQATKIGQPKVKHIDLARGGEVDYAGEVTFSGRPDRGQVRSWSNASGHYRPEPSAAPQAGLPIDTFVDHLFNRRLSKVGSSPRPSAIRTNEPETRGT